MSDVNRVYRLVTRPQGMVKDSDFALKEEPKPELQGEGQLLIRNLYLSIDPTQRGWLDLARVMLPEQRRWAVLRHIAIPAALPALASGLRVAAAVAPIGAVLGEWVGSSAGLGYLMLHANSRMQVDLMFAALLVLAALAVGLYFIVDASLKRLLPWHPAAPETSETD